MATSHVDYETNALAFSPRLESIHAAIEAARAPDREGPYGLYEYVGEGDPVPYHVRDFRDPGNPGYGRSVFRSADRDEARLVYERLTAEHVAIAAVRATLKALGLSPLRHQSVCATPEQKDAGRAGPLYARGDMQLIWVNLGDLCQHDMIPNPSDMGAMAAIERHEARPDRD